MAFHSLKLITEHDLLFYFLFKGKLKEETQGFKEETTGQHQETKSKLAVNRKAKRHKAKNIREMKKLTRSNRK